MNFVFLLFIVSIYLLILLLCAFISDALASRFKDKILDWLDVLKMKHNVERTIIFISEWGNLAGVFIFGLLTMKYATLLPLLSWLDFLVYVITTFVLVTSIFFIGNIAEEYYCRHYDDFHNATSNTTKSSDDESKDDGRSPEDTTDYSERIMNATDETSKND